MALLASNRDAVRTKIRCKEPGGKKAAVPCGNSRARKRHARQPRAAAVREILAKPNRYIFD